jgi:hypothetical protein
MAPYLPGAVFLAHGAAKEQTSKKIYFCGPESEISRSARKTLP